LRIMAIDIGTNSTTHLVADTEVNKLNLIERGLVGNKLGLDLRTGNQFNDDTIASNRKYLNELMLRANELGCERIRAIGTHALRNANNTELFTDMTREIGLELNVISEVEEARLAWLGQFGQTGSSVESAVLDIGGGSSELSIGIGVSPNWTSSIPIAGISTSNKHFRYDPPNQLEVERAKQSVEVLFNPWVGRLVNDCKFIGVSGVITSVASIFLKLANYSIGIFEGVVLQHDYISALSKKLLSMTSIERKNLPGMPLNVVNSIHGGVLILDHVMNILEKDRITVSERGVLFGLAYRLAENEFEKEK